MSVTGRSPSAAVQPLGSSAAQLEDPRCLAFKHREAVDQIQAFLGPETFLFTANVSRLWRTVWNDRQARIDGAEAPPSFRDTSHIDQWRSVRIRRHVWVDRREGHVRRLPKRTSLACAVASPPCLAWSMASGLEWSPYTLRAAAASPRAVDILTLALERGLFEPPSANGKDGTPGSGGSDALVGAVGRILGPACICVGAARAGSIETLEWAEENGFPVWVPLECSFAAGKGGHMHVLHWAAAKKLSEPLCAATSGAADGGHLEMLQLLHADGFPCDETVCENAARRGDLEMLIWARTVARCPWNKKTCFGAALGGHLEVLQWARSNGCPWSEITAAAAAMGGHLDVLKWAQAHDCPWSAAACREAAEEGHIDALRWLHANGCPVNKSVSHRAAFGGHLRVLKWAREHGCGWSEVTAACAAEAGQLAVLKWLREACCPWDAQQVAKIAAFQHHKELLRWAREQGAPGAGSGSNGGGSSGGGSGSSVA